MFSTKQPAWCFKMWIRSCHSSDRPLRLRSVLTQNRIPDPTVAVACPLRPAPALTRSPVFPVCAPRPQPCQPCSLGHVPQIFAGLSHYLALCSDITSSKQAFLTRLCKTGTSPHPHHIHTHTQNLMLSIPLGCFIFISLVSTWHVLYFLFYYMFLCRAKT